HVADGAGAVVLEEAVAGARVEAIAGRGLRLAVGALVEVAVARRVRRDVAHAASSQQRNRQEQTGTHFLLLLDSESVRIDDPAEDQAVPVLDARGRLLTGTGGALEQA